MKFLDAIRAPQYTLATRPAASTAAGRLVYVTDAAVGQKLQLSDAVAWGAAGINLAALSASTPDKLAWEYPTGTDIVELYGGVVPTGTLSLIATDDFSTDTIASGDWTVSTGGVFSVTGGKLLANGASPNYNLRWTARGQSTNQRRIRADRDRMGPGDRPIFPSPVYLDATNYITARIRFIDSTNCFLAIEKLDGGVSTILQNGTQKTQAQYSVGGTWVTEMERNGNVVTARIWQPGQNPDVDTPFDTVTHTLTAGNATKFGAGVNAYAGLAESDGVANRDNVKLWEALLEQRDLWVAVTPSGGSRTVKRVLGSLGGNLRSDFAQLIAAGTGQALQLPAFTLATRPSAIGLTATVIYVSDDTPGQRVQVSDGASWIPLETTTYINQAPGKWTDDFSTFQSTKYVILNGSFSSDGSKLVAGVANSQFRTSGLQFMRGAVLAKIVAAAAGNLRVGLCIGDRNNALEAVWQADGNLVLNQILGGSVGTISSTGAGAPVPAAGTYWIRMTVDSVNDVHVGAAIYNVDPELNPTVAPIKKVDPLNAFDQRFQYRMMEFEWVAASLNDALDSLYVR